jgi:hypothetical protein
MPASASVDPETGIAHYLATGLITREEILSVINQVYGDPQYRAPWRSLWEMRGAKPAINADELRSVVDHVRTHRPSTTGKIAIVAAEDLSFGLARMFEFLAGDQPVETRVFRDSEHARRWLTEDPAGIS